MFTYHSLPSTYRFNFSRKQSLQLGVRAKVDLPRPRGHPVKESWESTPQDSLITEAALLITQAFIIPQYQVFKAWGHYNCTSNVHKLAIHVRLPTQ